MQPSSLGVTPTAPGAEARDAAAAPALTLAAGTRSVRLHTARRLTVEAGHMTSYYSEGLSGDRLQRCYELASPRVQQYLESEIRYLLGRIGPDDAVLELGCGYGRVAVRLAGQAKRVVGIDVADQSLEVARTLAGSDARCEFALMDALHMSFADGSFDVVVCIQNGICAFGVPQSELMREALRVVRPGGRLIFSTYSDAFWADRLSWFESQSSEGLVGPIDHSATGGGVIVCSDGFRSGTATRSELEELCSELGITATITEVDGSSLFCEASKPCAS
jgi:2-polyprenyl-6-hydroxyphenyl methylase/3-demethylubiquinone-9 3-methyltransferase